MCGKDKKMAFDGIFFTSLVKELREHLIERRIEKINQHSDKIISLSFSRLKQIRLHISIEAENPFLAFSKDKLPNPEQAPMFCMLLRKHLGGGIVKDIRQLQGDRIILFEFASLNEMKDREKKYLIVEIMGRHSNLILTDDEMNVLDSLKHVNPLMSKRPMGPGYVYSPPFEEKTRIDDIGWDFFEKNNIEKTENDITSYLLQHIAGFSKHTTSQVLFEAKIDERKLVKDLSEEEIQRILKALENLKNELNTGHHAYKYENKKSKIEIANIHLSFLEELGYKSVEIRNEDYLYSSLVIDYFDKKGKNDVLIQQCSSLIGLIKQIIDKEKKRIKNLSKDITSAEKHDKYKLYGELLMANMHLVKKGMKSITVVNYYDNSEVEIPLKYDKSPSENAESFFKRYQKMKKTLVYANEQIEMAKDKIDHLESVSSALELVEDAEDFNAIRAELVSEGIIKEKASTKRKKADKKLAPREFMSPNGFTVKVGRNNFQNDELTLKSSSKNHIWLHTKIIPSSPLSALGILKRVNRKMYLSILPR